MQPIHLLVLPPCGIAVEANRSVQVEVESIRIISQLEVDWWSIQQIQRLDLVKRKKCFTSTIAPGYNHHCLSRNWWCYLCMKVKATSGILTRPLSRILCPIPQRCWRRIKSKNLLGGHLCVAEKNMAGFMVIYFYSQFDLKMKLTDQQGKASNNSLYY